MRTFFLVSVFSCALLSVNAQKLSPTTGRAKLLTGSVVINVKADGSLVVNRRTLNRAELTDLLKTLLQLDAKQGAVIRGDENCPYKNITEAIDICTEAGITNVAFALAKGSTPSPANTTIQQPDEKKSFDKMLQEIQATTQRSDDISNGLPAKPKVEQGDVTSVMNDIERSAAQTLATSPLPTFESNSNAIIKRPNTFTSKLPGDSAGPTKKGIIGSGKSSDEIIQENNKWIQENMAPAEATNGTERPKATLTVDQNDEIKLDGKIIAVENLEKALKNLPEIRRNGLALKANQKASFGTIVKVMDTLKLAGVKNLPPTLTLDQQP